MKPLLTGALMGLLYVWGIWFAVPILIAAGSRIGKIYKKVTKWKT